MVVRLVDGSPPAQPARRSAAAVEMAIILPFLAFMLAVAIDYCRVYYAVQMVNSAARCGALYASRTVPAANGLTPLQAAQEGAVAEGASLNPPLQATNVTLTSTTTNVTVTVNYQFSLISHYLFLPSPLNVSSAVTMPVASGASQ